MMEFMEIVVSDNLQFVRGAAVGMSLDPSGNTFYILQIISSDIDGVEQVTNYAIPPGANEGFVRVVNGMDPKRE